MIARDRESGLRKDGCCELAGIWVVFMLLLLDPARRLFGDDRLLKHLLEQVDPAFTLQIMFSCNVNAMAFVVARLTC